MLDWILANPTEAGTLAGVFLAILIAAVAAWKVGGFRQGLLALMLHADRARRQGKVGPIDGPQVMALVINMAMTKLVPQLPAWLRPVITPERIQRWAQAGFDLGLDYLDDGLLNGTRPTLPDEVAAADGQPPDQPAS